MKTANRRRHLKGVACALAGGTLWGFSGACSQYLFAHYDIDASFITAARMLGSGALFLVLLLATRRERFVAMLRDRASLRSLVIFGVFGLFACQFSYIASIGCTNAGTATVLQSLGTVWVMLAACALAKKPPRAGEALGLVFALFATFLIATQGNLSSLALPAAGLAWGLANSITVAIYIMYPKHLMFVWGTLLTTGAGMAIGGVAAGVAWAGPAVWSGVVVVVPALDATGWLVLAAIAVLGTFAAFTLYLHGVALVGPVTGSLLGAMEPVSATVFAALWLGTSFSAYDWVGFVLMVSMILLVSAAGGKKPADEEPLRGMGVEAVTCGDGKPASCEGTRPAFGEGVKPAAGSARPPLSGGVNVGQERKG